MKRGLLLLYVCFYLHPAFGQKEGNIWCFGANAGLDFNSGAPVGFTGVAMNQWEGCSSIADTSGHLLFYTDGNSVWNKNNVTMPNGTGLLGGNSSTQAAMIVKQPGNTNIYYLFTTDAFLGANGFKYNIVDMNQQAGLGDLTTKNVNILSYCDERVTAVHHTNGKDVWVITTTGNTDTIKAFLLTSSGFNTAPVISVSGITHGSSYQGYIHPSPDEKKLAVAYFNNGFDVYDFDRSTGLTSNGFAMKSGNYGTAYGVEFSPDGSKLYGVNDAGTNIYQFNLLAGSPSAVASSVVTVGTSADGALGSLQLAPDGKIYLARIYSPYSSYLGVINSPNASGTLCNFVDQGLYLQYGSSNIGLPNNFIYSKNSAPVVVAAFQTSATIICAGTFANFTNLSTGATSYQWSFPGAIPDTSTAQNPATIYYPDTGHYSVTLIAINGTTRDTLTKNSYMQIVAGEAAGLVIAAPDTVCAWGISVLNSDSSTGSIQWQYSLDGNNFTAINGVDSSVYTTPPLTQNITYRTVSVDGSCTDTSAPIMVTVNPLPNPPVLSANDSVICSNDSTIIQTTGTYSHYLWNNADTRNYTYAANAGGYWVTVTDANGCTALSAHKNIAVYPVPSVSIIVEGDTLSSFGAVTYQWYFNDTIIHGATSPVYIANRTGNYAVQGTDTNGCRVLSDDTYIDITITGINDLVLNSTLSIYPNPVSEQVHIVTGRAGNYTLYDAIGQEVRSFYLNVADNVIPVGDLSDGLYFVVNNINPAVAGRMVVAR